MKRFKATTEINGWDRQKRFINIAANKSMLYYATRNKSIYETYSISSICTNGISYRIIGKRNNRYKTFFVTPNQISRIGNNYISLTVCDNDVYPTMSDAELSDGSNCPVLSIYPYKIKPKANAIIYGDLSQRNLSDAETRMLDDLIAEMKDSKVDGISIEEYVYATGNSGLGNILNNSNQSNQSVVNNGYQKLSNYFTSNGIEINNISHLVKASNPFDNNYFAINYYRTKSILGGDIDVVPNCDFVFSSLIKALLNPDSVCKLNLSAGMVSKDLKVFDSFKNLQLLDISQNDLSEDDIKQIANQLPKGCKLVSQPQINVKRKIISLNNEVDTLHSQIERFQTDDYYKKETLNKYKNEQNFFNNILKENSRIDAEIEKIRNSKELNLEKSDFQLIGEVQLNISNLLDKISKLTDTKPSRNKKIKQMTLQQKLDPSTGPKRILALDGGGIRGALSLGYLEKLEQILKARHPHIADFRLCHYFDLIGGTSTGSIIAAALSIGLSVAEIKEKYFALGVKIFGQKNDWWNVFEIGKMVKANYSAEPLEKELKNMFQDYTLGDSEHIKTGLCIVAKRADTNSVWPLINHPKENISIVQLEPMEKYCCAMQYVQVQQHQLIFYQLLLMWAREFQVHLWMVVLAWPTILHWNCLRWQH
ncbi:MAG: patatin-like phospholipase family protein [Bacteroidetes bacterium]|nr:patatin-like phospholipase family protein [Bacteroidota bacterium]